MFINFMDQLQFIYNQSCHKITTKLISLHNLSMTDMNFYVVTIQMHFSWNNNMNIRQQAMMVVLQQSFVVAL